jgi:phosphoglycolate phosphatase-like HAD superfamily hydrolase
MRVSLDLDGTLLTCRPKQLTCLSHVLRRFGLSADLASIWDAKREGATTRDALLCSGLGAVEADLVSATWVSCIEEPFWLSFDRLLPEVASDLSRVTYFDARPDVLTSRSRPEWVQPQLRALGLSQYIGRVFVVSPRTSVQSKASILMETKPDVFIGDSEADWEAARTAGIRFVAVATGQRSPNYLRGKGVAEISGSLSEAFLASRDLSV